MINQFDMGYMGYYSLLSLRKGVCRDVKRIEGRRKQWLLADLCGWI
jgi:hypothetical protein